MSVTSDEIQRIIDGCRDADSDDIHTRSHDFTHDGITKRDDIFDHGTFCGFEDALFFTNVHNRHELFFGDHWR